MKTRYSTAAAASSELAGVSRYFGPWYLKAEESIPAKSRTAASRVPWRHVVCVCVYIHTEAHTDGHSLSLSLPICPAFGGESTGACVLTWLPGSAKEPFRGG